MANETMVLLEKIVVPSGGASSITFTSIPQSYTDLVIKISARTTASSETGSYMRFNGSATTNYSYLQLRSNGSTVTSSVASSQAETFPGRINDNAYTANTFSSGEVYIPNYSGSTNKSISVDAVTENNASTAEMGFVAGLRAVTDAITSILIAPSGGNWSQHSTFYLYGVAKQGVTPTNAPAATGGDSIVFDGTYWIHTFYSSGTFTPKKALTCDYLVVAGGGGGGTNVGGGGGAGGLRSTVTATGGGGSLESALSLTASTSYTVTVGAGGAGKTTQTTNGNNGSNSSISGSGITTITSIGGGGGSGSSNPAQSGGSGGGGSGDGYVGGAGTANQGYAGGTGQSGNYYVGAGGGGAGAVGVTPANNTSNGGNGGAGVAVSITGSSVTYAGGGGGARDFSSGQGAGGAGGGGAANRNANATNGTANTGGGGGGEHSQTASHSSGDGGSGIVIVRYAA
jgi:hypothetical protein